MKLKRIILSILLIIFLLTVKSFATNNINVVSEGQTKIENNNQNNTEEKQDTTNQEYASNNQINNEEQNQNDTKQVAEEPKQSTSSNNTTNSSSASREKSTNANLKSLKLDIDGMLPEFSSNITEYNITIPFNIEEINVHAETEDKNATYKLRGNKDLKAEENKIQVIVKAEDGTTKTYIINVKKTEESEETNAKLKTLNIKGFNFYPSFKDTIYNYSLTINKKIDSLDILAETEIEDAILEIEGNSNLQEGENIIKIIVTAKDGVTKREYKINTFISSKHAKPYQINKKHAYALIAILGIAILGTGVLAIKNKKN